MDFAFKKKNYTLLLIGLAFMASGLILMIGGGSDDPNTFNEAELFSPIRITLAPFLIVAGYVIIFYAIMKKAPSSEEDEYKK